MRVVGNRLWRCRCFSGLVAFFGFIGSVCSAVFGLAPINPTLTAVQRPGMHWDIRTASGSHRPLP